MPFICSGNTPLFFLTLFGDQIRLLNVFSLRLQVSQILIDNRRVMRVGKHETILLNCAKRVNILDAINNSGFD